MKKVERFLLLLQIILTNPIFLRYGCTKKAGFLEVNRKQIINIGIEFCKGKWMN